MKKAGLNGITAVVGNRPELIISHLCDLGIQFAYNSFWEKGQLSSIQTAIRTCPASAKGILFTLVDQPGIKSDTYKKLIKKIKSNPRNIIVASYNSRRGHPVWFPKKIFPALLKANLNRGARPVIQKYASTRIEVPVNDSAVTQDIDTRSNLKLLLQS